MEVFERIKFLRKEYLKLTQEDFSSKIKISRSNLGSIEVGRISVTDRVIADICSAFGINEQWLRTGNGEMFRQDEETIISQLTNEFHLDDLDCRIIKNYLQLEESQRKIIKDYIRSIFRDQFKDESANEIDMEVESYRHELEREKSIEMSSALQHTGENAG